MSSYTFDEESLSDLHKDAYGFRPKEDFWLEWNAASMDEKQEIWNKLLVDQEQEVERERLEQEAAARRFVEILEKARAIAPNLSTKQLIEILLLKENEESPYGNDYIEWKLGLPYGFLERIQYI